LSQHKELHRVQDLARIYRDYFKHYRGERISASSHSSNLSLVHDHNLGSPIQMCTIAAQGRAYATLDENGLVTVMSATEGTITTKISAGVGRGLAISADGNFIATGALGDEFARVWDVKHGTQVAVLGPLTYMAMCLKFADDDSLLYVNSNTELSLWNTKTWQKQAGFANPPAAGGGDLSGNGWGLDLSESTGLLASTFGSSVRIWKVSDSTYRDFTDPSNIALKFWVYFVQNGSRVISGQHGGIYGFSLSDGKPFLEDQPNAFVTAISADSLFAAVAGDDANGTNAAGVLYLCDSVTWTVLASIQAHSKTIWGTAISTAKRLIVSGGKDGHVKLWSFN